MAGQITDAGLIRLAKKVDANPSNLAHGLAYLDAAVRVGKWVERPRNGSYVVRSLVGNRRKMFEENLAAAGRAIASRSRPVHSRNPAREITGRPQRRRQRRA